MSRLVEDCDSLMERLSSYNVTPSEAEELSSRFLDMTYRINKHLRDIKNEQIKFSILDKNKYADAFKELDNKLSVSKQKALASSNKEYLRANVMLQKNSNEIDYWKSNLDICQDAHKFYKSLCRD